MFKFFILFLFLTSLFATDKSCYTIQLTSAKKSKKNYDLLSLKEYEKECKLMEIGGSITVRCGCYTSFSQAQQQLIPLKKKYQDAYVATSYTYRFDDTTPLKEVVTAETPKQVVKDEVVAQEKIEPILEETKEPVVTEKVIEDINSSSQQELPQMIAKAAQKQHDKVEIFATSMDYNKSVVEATNGVSVVYQEYILTANRALYNKDTGVLELFDNVRANSEGKYKILGSYAKLNISKKERVFKPFFMMETESEVWMSADKGEAQKNEFSIGSGVISGCNPKDPLWQMEFSSSDYDTQTKWLNIYNTTFYIYDIPVFYTPYFGYSLDTTRRTGLLKPSIGLSSDEGFYYQQSLYIAEADNWDLEITPQIRTTRGSGLYSTLRFVDSNVSKGSLTAGFFNEKASYVSANQLANDKHFGFNFEYENSDFLNSLLGRDLSGQSGLYMDLNKMNDVDYINLSSNSKINYSTATLVLSRVNMFYNTDDNYYGAYFTYYQDLTKDSNAKTLQKLPTLQYHHYLDTFFDNYFFYDFDVKSNNIQRSVDKTAVQTDFNIPLTVQTPLFDEYLNVSYKLNLYAQHSTFAGKESQPVVGDQYKSGYFARYFHTFNVATELTKAYEENIHVVSFGATYNLNGSESKNGYYKDYNLYCSDPVNKDQQVCEFYNITNIDDSMELNFAQYLYNSKMEQILYHRLSQKFVYTNTATKVGELENELEYKINQYMNIYNNMFYNFDQNAFSKIYNSVGLSGYGFDVAFAHLYKDSFIPSTATTLRRTSYLSSDIDYQYNEHYSYHTKYNYDLQTKQKKSVEVGFLYKKRCWNFGIKYVENNRPVLTQNGTDSVYDKYIYFTIVLKPLMADNATSEIAYQISNSN